MDSCGRYLREGPAIRPTRLRSRCSTNYVGVGYIEGQNLTITYRAYAAHVDLTSQYASELVKAQVDVILAAGDVAIRAAQQATKTIPILAFTDDLVGSGLVNSMARPGGNTTGISVFAPELNGKRQELLIEAVPGLRRMAALADSNTTSDVQLRVLRESARSRDIDLSIHRVAKGEEVVAAINSAKASGATALNVLGSPLLWANRYLIMDRVAALHLPAMYSIARNSGGRWVCCLRTTRRAVVSGYPSSTTGPTFPRNQGRRHSCRTADQVRAGDQYEGR